MALFGIWFAWLFFAEVGRYEVSETARVEVDRAAHRVAVPGSGRVTAVHLALNASVAAGDVLVELDDQPQRRELEEKHTRLRAAQAQIEPILREIAAREETVRETQQAGKAQIDEARARFREADVAARFLELEAERVAALRGKGFLTEAEKLRTANEAETKRIAAEANMNAASRIEAERRSRLSELRAELAALQRQSALLEGEQAALEASIAALLGEIERRKISAPVAGRVGEITVLRAGAYLKEGDFVAAIIPAGVLRVVADFPLTSVGLLRVGQPARVRLDAFPWTEYGSLRATVESAGTEAQRGRVRVELALELDPTSPIPVQHGLPGHVIVEIERLPPATLLLRAVGQLLRAPAEAMR